MLLIVCGHYGDLVISFNCIISMIKEMKTMLQKIFAQNIKKYRAINGYSQEDLAHISGLHRTYISGIEMGKRNVSIKNIEKIAKAFNVSPSKLLEGGDI